MCPTQYSRTLPALQKVMTCCTQRIPAWQSALGNGTWRWEPEICRENSLSPHPELLLHALAIIADGFELQMLPGLKGSEWKLRELRRRTYRALGSLKTQQGNLPTKKKTWQYVFRSSIHYKEVWGVNIYARCMLMDGQAAWFGTARENSPVTNHGQGWHSSSVLLLCALWAWLRAC